jgi:hypothetical protein
MAKKEATPKPREKEKAKAAPAGPKYTYVLVVQDGRSRLEAREGTKVVRSRRVSRRNRYKG